MVLVYEYTRCNKIVSTIFQNPSSPGKPYQVSSLVFCFLARCTLYVSLRQELVGDEITIEPLSVTGLVLESTRAVKENFPIVEKLIAVSQTRTEGVPDHPPDRSIRENVLVPVSRPFLVAAASYLAQQADDYWRTGGEDGFYMRGDKQRPRDWYEDVFTDATLGRLG